MYLPTTHMGFGILAAAFASIILWSPINPEAVIWGMIFGFLPDIDYIYYLVRFGVRPAKYSHEHRQALTHSFLPHFCISLILFFLLGSLWGLVYFFSVLSHLVLDSAHKPWGVRWFWPLAQKYYSFGPGSGVTSVTKEELDTYTETRGDQPWVARFVRLNNPYFLFETLSSLGFVAFLIHYFS